VSIFGIWQLMDPAAYNLSRNAYYYYLHIAFAPCAVRAVHPNLRQTYLKQLFVYFIKMLYKK